MNGYTMSESIDRLEKRVQSLESSGSGGGGGTAAGVSYDPTGTSLTSNNVQEAISEVDSNVTNNVADIEALQTEVTNLGLDKQDKLPDPTLGKFLKEITTGLSWESVEANDVEFNNTGTGMESTNVQDALEEVFQSVSDGKEYLAEKITDKGVPTSATATFQVMGDNIEAIESGGDFSELITPTLIPNVYINASTGAQEAYSGWYATDWIDIHEYDYLIIYMNGGTGQTSFNYNCTYNEGKSRINSHSIGVNTNVLFNTGSAYYLRLSNSSQGITPSVKIYGHKR